MLGTVLARFLKEMNKHVFENTATLTVGREKPILSLAVSQLQLCFSSWQRANFLCTHLHCHTE